MRVYTTDPIFIEKCNHNCPAFVYESGMGHCDDWYECKRAKKIIDMFWDVYKNPTHFPDFCPLKEVDFEKTSINTKDN
jgi:hypothetical protein